MNRRGFTLLELMMASVLCAVLMGGILSMLSGVARDRKRLDAAQPVSASRGIIELLQRDLAAADSFSSSPDGHTLTITGHGALDARNLTPTLRLARITYRVVGRDADQVLIREQEMLDDAARPRAWQTLAAAGVSSLRTNPASAGDATASELQPMPARLSLTLERGAAAERYEVFVR